MLVWMTLVAGFVVIAGGVLVVLQVDRRWRTAHLECCRCLEVWFGRDKMCYRCGARGHHYDWLARKFAGFPTHDWQGYLDTGPIPRIPAQAQALHGADPAAARIPQPRAAPTQADVPQAWAD